MSSAPDRARHPAAPVLLHLSFEIDPGIDSDVDSGIESSVDQWCERDADAYLRRPGVLSLRRFKRNDDWSGDRKAARFMTLLDLEDASVLSELPSDGLESSIPEALVGRVRARRAVYCELGAEPGSRMRAAGSAILHVCVDVDREYDDRFQHWYAGTHVPAVLEAPGMIGARRFENILHGRDGSLPQGQHEYCTVYEMEQPSVIGSPETLEAARKGACPAELEPHRVAINHVYDEISRRTAAP
jgi:hypothetical protein